MIERAVFHHDDDDMFDAGMLRVGQRLMVMVVTPLAGQGRREGACHA